MKLIRDRMKATQAHQKSFADLRKTLLRSLEKLGEERENKTEGDQSWLKESEGMVLILAV